MNPCTADRHGSIAYHQNRLAIIRNRSGGTFGSEAPYHHSMIAILRGECSIRPTVYHRGSAACVEPDPGKMADYYEALGAAFLARYGDCADWS